MCTRDSISESAHGQDKCATYPTDRPQFFANKFVRLLAKTCVAQELGLGEFALLVTVAMTEDVARYRRAVTWYNVQLMPILGMSKDTLVRVRKHCVDEGWLNYRMGAKRRPGRYWVTIPEHAIDIDDTTVDEGEAEDSVRNSDGIPTASRRKPRLKADGKVSPFIPIPKPTPDPEGRALDDFDSEIELLVSEWNRITDIRHIRNVTAKRRAALRKCLSNSDWRVHWRSGLARIAKSSFCSGGGERGWKATLDWFLKSDTLNSLLEGKYDGSANSPTKGPRNDSGQIFDGDLPDPADVSGI